MTDAERILNHQRLVTKLREVQLKNLQRDNSVLRARLAWLKRFGDLPLRDWRRLDEAENFLRGRVRGTPEAYTLGQRGSTPRPATSSTHHEKDHHHN